MFNLKNRKLKLVLYLIIMNGALFTGFQFYKTSTKIDLFTELDQTALTRLPSVYRENFSDTASSGEVLKSKKGYEFHYEKSDKIKYPFVAAFFPIEDLKLDFENYDIINLEIEAKRAKRIPLLLSMHYEDSLVRYLTYFLDFDSNQTHYQINLNEFKTPPEWFTKHNVSLIDLPPPSFSNIKTISFESGQLLEAGKKDVYTIKQIILNKNPQNVWYLFIVILILFNLVVSIFTLGVFKKKTEIKTVPIQEVEVELKETALEKITNYLGQNYKDPNLSLWRTQKAIGIKGQTISETLKAEFQLSFPQYIAKIRIEEAKRIFQHEPFESISNVGYDVGFNSPSNFNRVFKSIEGVSPSQFIENK